MWLKLLARFSKKLAQPQGVALSLRQEHIARQLRAAKKKEKENAVPSGRRR